MPAFRRLRNAACNRQDQKLGGGGLLKGRVRSPLRGGGGRSDAMAQGPERERSNNVKDGLAGHFHAAGQKGPFLNYPECSSEGQWHRPVNVPDCVEQGFEGGSRQDSCDLQVQDHHVDLHGATGLRGLLSIFDHGTVLLLFLLLMRFLDAAYWVGLAADRAASADACDVSRPLPTVARSWGT